MFHPIQDFFEEESGSSNTSKNVIEIKIRSCKIFLWSKNIVFLMLILRTLTHHRNCIRDFEGIFARPQVSQRDVVTRQYHYIPFPQSQSKLDNSTLRQHLSLYNATWGRAVTRNQREGESLVATLKRVMSRRHRVIGFSLWHVYISLPLSHFLSRANLRCLRRHACRRSRWAGLACQNLPDAASRTEVQKQNRRGWERDGEVATERRRASR